MLSEEDEAPQSDHSVELETGPNSPFPTRRRRIAQVAVVAVMLGASGLIALAVVEHRRALADEQALESAQSAQLQDGWKTLGAVAAEEARVTDVQNAAAQAPAAPTVPPPAATTTIVIVNPPAQPARNTATADARAVPSGAMPTPSVSTRTVYVPTPVPVIANDTNGANIPGQSLSNGSEPGSLQNPALPNGSSNDVPSAPGQANSAGSSAPEVPAAPVGAVPASPPESGITP